MCRTDPTSAKTAASAPFGRALAIITIIIWLAALTRLHTGEALLIGITAAIAAGNWWWAQRENARKTEVYAASAPSRSS